MIKVKDHVFTNGNINHHRVDEMLKESYPHKLDICYTDPPWGNGNLKYWATMNKKANDRVVDQINQEELETRVVDLICKNVQNYAFIVYGVKQAESIINKLKAKSEVTDVQYYEKTYKSGSSYLKNCIICVTLNGSETINFSEHVENKKGTVALKNILELFGNKFNTCLELFVGIGYYLKILDGFGYKVAGNELNEARLKKAIGKISK